MMKNGPGGLAGFRRVIVGAVAVVALWGTAGEVAERDLQRGSRDFWDLKALDAAPQTFAVEIPCSNEYGRVEGVEPIWIEGEPYRGKPTRVFAWWGLPKGASPAAKVPAMVLVHGGGGTAFQSWVKTWNERGYAAIAMDTCGKIPQGERDGKPHNTHPWSGPSGWGSSVAQVNEPLKDQWTYHAVAAVMRCHSFLRSRPEVDANHIGLTGISWGGYLTSIVMGVDDRFTFAAPVYGCGWYDLNPQWNHMGTPENYRKWLALWDPKNYIQGIGKGSAKRPVLWCCGTNDRWYPLDAVRRSYSLVDPAVPLTLSLKLRMPHGHGKAGDPKEITAMAEHYLRGGRPLVAVTDAWLRDGRLNVTFNANGRKLAKAELLATCGKEPVLEQRRWTATPIADFKAASGRLAVPVSENATMFFVNLITDDGLVVSTRVFERKDWGLAANPRNPATDWMAGKVGLFAHYLYGGDMAGRVAAEFDVPGLVKQVLDSRADYFCLTLGQNSGWMCSPNTTYEQKVGYGKGERCCQRDLPAEIAAALRPHGVKFMLYLPCQPPNCDARAEGAFGFPQEGRGDRQINRSAAREWAKVIEEWSRRYGDAVSGWWFDGAYRWCRFDDEIAEIYAAACKRGNPNAVVAFNEGVRKPVRRWTEAGDYLAGEVNEPLDEVCNGRFLGGRQWHALTYCGKSWGHSDCRFSDEQWIQWMGPVLAKGGAVTVDVHIDRPTGRLCPEQVAQMKRVFTAVRDPRPQAPTAARELFNGRDLTNWYTYLRGRGRNVDPKGVFTVTNGVIHVTGEEMGCITTEEAFKDYRLTVEYRWLGTAYGNKRKNAPDSGILFHSTGPDGGFGGIWMKSVEYNLILGASGDFWTVGTPDRPDIYLKAEVGEEKLGGRYYIHEKGGREVTLIANDRVCRNDIARDWTDTPGVKPAGNERPLGEWNTATLVCRGDEVECWFNGKLVNRATHVNPAGGRIQLQSEFCGVEFRRIAIEPCR